MMPEQKKRFHRFLIKLMEPTLSLMDVLLSVMKHNLFTICTSFSCVHTQSLAQVKNNGIQNSVALTHNELQSIDRLQKRVLFQFRAKSLFLSLVRDFLVHFRSAF